MKSVSFWACAQLHPNRARLARLLLEERGYEIYVPMVRESRKRIAALFPGYLFLLVTLQWSPARWCPGVIRLVMDGEHPAHVPPDVLEGIRERERNGIVVLPRQGPQPGDRVRIVRGPFIGHLAVYAGMSAHERVAVLLQILGSQQRVTLAQRDVEAIIF